MSEIDFETAIDQIDPSWREIVTQEFGQPYMLDLLKFLKAEHQGRKILFPDHRHWFSVFESNSFNSIKVVVLGQDPYHGSGQAHGLCFSVLPGVKIPPSLMNIYKEMNRDLGLPIPKSGCLQSWADQGVLLLNATLTVEKGTAGSHQGQGWEQFTDRVIERLNDRRDGLVFMLWGSHAQKKGRFIDENKHLVLKSSHPSPLSSYRGFLGCGHFSSTNAYLQERGEVEINWRLS
jgi:uracil-DNA glycosylase